MSLPDDQLASTPVFADYIAPYNRPRDARIEDFENGGIAIGDGSLGTDVQTWDLRYYPETGDFIVTPESIGAPSTVLTVEDVTRVGLAWNQNMDVFLAYELQTGEAKFYWYDSLIADHTTSTLTAGSRDVVCCLDDHRLGQTGTSDIILAYIRNGTLYYRQQRDRFSPEIPLASGLGTARLHRVGMTKNNRLKFEVRVGGGIRLCDIVGDIAIECGLSGAELELSELCETEVRGYLISDLSSGAEFIRSLQRVYFFDMVGINGKLTAMLRGRPTVGTIYLDDMVLGAEPLYETSRELETEFPAKVSLVWSSAESDYGTEKATSEVRSETRSLKSELLIDSAVNFESEEANQRVDILHKDAITQLNGRVSFAVPENWARLTPGDPWLVEVRPGVFRRIRVETTDEAEGVIRVKGVHDRASNYASIVEGVDFLDPTAPPPSLPGETTFEFLDVSAFVDDSLHYKIAAYGESVAWVGAVVQREVAPGDWVDEATISHAETLGLLDEGLAYAPEWYTDTTNDFLVTTNKALYSITDSQLLTGGNYAAIGSNALGWEIIQFRDVVEESGSWRISHLLRGRKNTTPFAHGAGERFVLIDEPEIIAADSSLIGESFDIRVPSIGTIGSDASPITVTFNGESAREWAPFYLEATQAGNDWAFTWIARHRFGYTASAIPSIYFQGFRIYLTVGATRVSYDVTDPEFDYSEAMQTADFGSAQSSFDNVTIVGLNSITGEGYALTEAIP